MQTKNYSRLVVSLVLSFFIMYAVMFLNVDARDLIFLSLTRTYMCLLMVSPMTILMLLSMPHMYKKDGINRIIIISAVIIFSASLSFLRNQTFISDRNYMKAMIPHHSSAILTSKNTHLLNPEVRKLADSIIASQEREIRQMEGLLLKMK